MQDQLDFPPIDKPKLLQEIKRTLESEKLALWSFKAELSTLNIRIKKIQKASETLEETFISYQKEALETKSELDYCSEVINVSVIYELLKTASPWKIMQDVCAGICRLIGFSNCSWVFFLKLVKDEEVFKEALKSYNASEVDKEAFELVTGIIKKHGLGLRVKDGKFPEEFSILTKWLLYAYHSVLSLKNSEKTAEQLVSTNQKHNTIYIELLEMQNIIQEHTGKVTSLLEAIEICENNSRKWKKVKNFESFEVEILKAELLSCEKTLKRCRGAKELVNDDTPVSCLVDSLFVSQSYSPEPRIIEAKKYNEDSFIDLPVQRGLQVNSNTMENTLTEVFEHKKKGNKDRKKCCNIMAYCK